MNHKENTQSLNNSTPKIPWKVIIRFIITILFMLGVLFLAGGSLNWWEAWAYAAMTMIVLLSSRAVLILKNPELAKERSEAGQKENVKPWDKILMPITAIYLPLISWVVVGLDKRFGWSPDLPDTVQVLGLVVIFLGSMIGTWAMITNRFFSSHVRIQTDRGHTVVNSGPYKVIRHPGYVGGILSWLAAPVFFSSYWIVIPTILAIIGAILRTALEDWTLQEELPGYEEYASTVRYRLIPGIW